MSFTSVSKTIQAPKDVVFATISDVSNFSKAVPHILEVEFLTEQRNGLGSRFRETREMNGRKATTELEVTEFVENERVRMVSDAGGTIWDTLFSVSSEGDATRLDVVMDARPHRFLARLVTPLIKGMVSKAVEKDIDAVKAYCESL